MQLHWPQITWIVIASLALFVTAVRNGKPKTGEYNFALDVCSTAVAVWLLWSGGFFTGAPG